uniref:Uncharacterized protein n=1 Tax=Magnetospirillum gryphiswaldense TaxID=55518 RepID=Q3BKI7_9PROT|nr:hypothetical protein mgI379 [Magnetospirillum gryphiswaldense MSR-1]
MRTDAACASLPCVFTLSKSRRTFVLRSVSPSGAAAFSFSLHPVVSGRPAYIRAPGAPSTSFFAALRFFRSTRRRRSPPPISFPVSADRSVSAGPVFYLDAGAPSTSFFAPLKFFQRQAEKFTSALLPVDLTNTSSHQRGAVSTSAPPRRQPLFSRPRKLSSPTPPRSRCRPPRPQHPDHSVRRGGRFVAPASAPVNPYFTVL